MTQTITFTFRGIAFETEIDYEEGEPMRYDHLSIKPDGDDANFLYWFQHAPEWPEIDRAIDQSWNDWITSREACGYDDPMDSIHAEIESELLYQ